MAFYVPFPKLWSYCLKTMRSHARDRCEVATIYEQFHLCVVATPIWFNHSSAVTLTKNNEYKG